MVTRKRPIKRSAQVAAIDNDNENEIQDDGASQPKVPKELLVIAQEVKIVRALACNDLTKRNRQIRKLRKWFQLRAVSSFPFTEDDFMRIWKGLYYNVWMSDKPLVQEELAEQLAQMVDSFGGNTACSLAYFSAFMRTMCQEWFGIDQWRMDKFLMLVRRMVRYMLRLLKKSKWSPELIQTFNATMQQSVLAEQPKSRGLTMHYMDVFFEELAKAANEEITAAQVNLFLLPFVHYVGTQRDPKLVAQCRTRVFYHLLYQSELGREYSEKYKAWKEMGFPSASIDDVEKLDSGFDEEEEEEDEKQPQPETISLDPRAGNVDVLMPELPLNADCVLEELQTLLRTQEYNSKRRKGLRKLLHIFETYAAGEFPLGVRNMPKPEGTTLAELVEQKITDADEFEESNFGTGRNLKKLSKSKRKRLLSSINFEEVDEDNFNEVLDNAMTPKLRKQVKRNEKVRSSINNAWVVEKVDENGDKPTEKATANKPESKKAKKTAQKDELPKQKTKLQVKQQSKAQPTVVPTNEELTTDKEVTKVAPAEAKSNGWEEPLKPGEQDYFVPSRKVQLKQANNKLLLNPLAAQVTPKNPVQRIKLETARTDSGSKKVRIVTKCNSAYPKSDYYRQLKLSPQLPYDANRQPGKSALKPHVLPGPINPNYKKPKRLFNDTL
ncbi:ribosomal RNA processing protein 1 homolog [Drosophila sulfurigaster albostrigata]|uniref:ribosomal RNA processing protein 1 homolog n=1 Tax=Drosophila sulfurigaster albostrigata TaxID=89887 RepID=UPI002D21D56B|nr:ribosomal RNA processing protein 1 homolog [Drosophila sulfurigaster albostrigata]